MCFLCLSAKQFESLVCVYKISKHKLFYEIYLCLSVHWWSLEYLYLMISIALGHELLINEQYNNKNIVKIFYSFNPIPSKKQHSD